MGVFYSLLTTILGILELPWTSRLLQRFSSLFCSLSNEVQLVPVGFQCQSNVHRLLWCTLTERATRRTLAPVLFYIEFTKSCVQFWSTSRRRKISKTNICRHPGISPSYVANKSSNVQSNVTSSSLLVGHCPLQFVCYIV